MKKHDFDEILAKIDALEPSDAPHDKKMAELQAYNIKAVVALIDVFERLNQQSQELEETNVKLQRQIFILTVVMGTLAVLTFLFDLLDLFSFV